MSKDKTLNFMPIDLRDRGPGAVCTYYLNRNNVRVCAEAEREYYRKLKKLQEELRAKYEPQLVEGHEFSHQSSEHNEIYEEYAMSYEEARPYEDLWDS